MFKADVSKQRTEKASCGEHTQPHKQERQVTNN